MSSLKGCVNRRVACSVHKVDEEMETVDDATRDRFLTLLLPSPALHLLSLVCSDLSTRSQSAREDLSHLSTTSPLATRSPDSRRPIGLPPTGDAYFRVLYAQIQVREKPARESRRRTLIPSTNTLIRPVRVALRSHGELATYDRQKLVDSTHRDESHAIQSLTDLLLLFPPLFFQGPGLDASSRDLALA